MLRMGPANAAIIKTKLRELRSQLAERSRDSDRSRGGPALPPSTSDGDRG
jgi:hypothetical protein